MVVVTTIIVIIIITLLDTGSKKLARIYIVQSCVELLVEMQYNSMKVQLGSLEGRYCVTSTIHNRL